MCELLESLAAGLCHRIDWLTPGLFCHRCLGLYGGALTAGFLLYISRFFRRLPRKSLWYLWLYAAPLIVDELLVTLGVWSPPGWWRTLTGALGGAALYPLLAHLVPRLRGEGKTGTGEKTEPSVVVPLLTPPLTAALLTGMSLLGWSGVLDALGLTGAALVLWTVGALLWVRLPADDRPARVLYYVIAGVSGAALWLLLVILRGAVG